MELVQNLTGLYRAGHDPEDADEADLKPPTPPRKEEPKANEAASPEEVESSCYNCVDYAKNYAVFESDFLCSNNKPLLTFADPSFFFSGWEEPIFAALSSFFYLPIIWSSSFPG